MAGAAFERDEMVKLLKASSIPEAAIADFERCHVGTITRFSSYAVGKLVTEPPHAGTLTALLASLKAGSALAGAEAWPDPNVAGEAANYTLLTANMTALCRFVMLQKDTAARRELAYVGAAGTADDAAQRAISGMHEKEFDGRPLTVNEAKPRESGGGGGGRGGYGGGGRRY